MCTNYRDHQVGTSTIHVDKGIQRRIHIVKVENNREAYFDISRFPEVI